DDELAYSAVQTRALAGIGMQSPVRTHPQYGAGAACICRREYHRRRKMPGNDDDFWLQPRQLRHDPGVEVEATAVLARPAKALQRFQEIVLRGRELPSAPRHLFLAREDVQVLATRPREGAV